jgi:hypothetical protein
MTFIATLLLSFVVIVAVIVAMSLGVLNGREPIKGSCGGLSGSGCELCSGDGICRRRQGPTTGGGP